MILLDTGILFNFFAGKTYSDCTEELIAEGQAAISTITVYELFAGVKDKKHIAQRQQLLSLCEVVPMDSKIVLRASDIYTSLKAEGRLICNEDIIVAASALELNVSLFTTNAKHFINIRNLTLFQEPSPAI